MFARNSTYKVRLGWKLACWFLVIAFVPLLIMATTMFRRTEEGFRLEITNSLAEMARFKSRRIEDYIAERRRDAIALSHMPGMSEALRQLSTALATEGINAASYLAIDGMLRPFLTHFQQRAGYRDLYLIAPNGDIVFSSMRGNDFRTNLNSGPYQSSQLAWAFEQSRTLMDAVVSELEHYPATGEPAAFIAAPLFYDTQFSGVVALQVNTADIYPLIREDIGLGETGETLVATLVDGRAWVTAPMRHDERAAFRRSFASDDSMPLAMAAAGQSGSGIVRDYRGRETLAAWRYLPSLRWGMLVKVDVDEAFASQIALEQMAIRVMSLTLLGVIVVALVLARSLSKPLNQMTESTKAIAAGDLSRRIAVKTRDELGVLAGAFNDMTDKLRTTLVSRDELAAEIQERERLAQVIREVVSRLNVSSSQILAAVSQQTVGVVGDHQKTRISGPPAGPPRGSRKLAAAVSRG